jgi:hypothetical protein
MRRFLPFLVAAAALATTAVDANAQINVQFGTPNYGYAPNVFNQNSYVPYQYGATQYYGTGVPVITNYGGYSGYTSYYAPQYNPGYYGGYPANYGNSYYGQAWNGAGRNYGGNIYRGDWRR